MLSGIPGLLEKDNRRWHPAVWWQWEIVAPMYHYATWSMAHAAHQSPYQSSLPWVSNLFFDVSKITL